MQLSVVIVNYNVRHFLEQCLLSVNRGLKNTDAEIFVVDNASGDDSVEMVRQKFPSVKIIENQSNVGFSKANNQAIEKATGEYILLLNPDTVVAEDTFQKCIAFMKTHPDAGALGVKMVDGKGNFLPESKRGLPTPSVAFYKTFGLASLFPKSKTFGKYHLGFLSQNETHEVEILSGAFMFMKKAALDKTGMLDEVFFMYGEDIDLSYRLLKAGFKNYYFPEASIIHYKGESTKKGSLNYVKVFYQAMLIFARKHFSQRWSGFFLLLINFAIVLRGGLTLVANLFASSYLFIFDAVLGFTGIYFIKRYWEDMIKYSDNYYPNEFLFIVVPGYILIWVVAVFFAGGYDKPFRVSNVFRGVLLGTIGIAVMYAFIPNEWRFSRAIILLGAAWTGFEMLFTRGVYHLIKYQSLSVEKDEDRRSLIVGTTEVARAESALRELGNTREIISSSGLTKLRKLIAIHRINEVIFCSIDFSYGEIIRQIVLCGNKIDYKIINEGSTALIGSNSKNTSGDLYIAEKNYSLFKASNLRNKRVFDFMACIALTPLMPLNIFLVENFGKFVSNWVSVLSGKKAWVGFSSQHNLQKFPSAAKGVLHPSNGVKDFDLNEEDKTAIELSYAKYYSLSDDVVLFLKNYRNLGL